MRLKTATIEYGRVINLGQYNSLRASCTLGAELDEGEDVDKALAELWEKARESVRAQVVRVVERGRAGEDEGLHHSADAETRGRGDAGSGSPPSGNPWPGREP
jgi:hypothetical protein